MELFLDKNKLLVSHYIITCFNVVADKCMAGIVRVGGGSRERERVQSLSSSSGGAPGSDKFINN